ncbi:MAG: aldehyde reductase, partial [Tunicatimonas sp.]|uniref:SDR family oxidoreductase n=1 Tax=Tunicatimonas sp. TaxID=1940096 RepID=UPI003C7178CE
VLVTGANGYVASWIVKQLLEQGTAVHATVRNQANTVKYQHLLDIATQAPGTLHMFEADLLKPGSFDEAMVGCDVVMHTASPFKLQVDDPYQGLIDPALEGTNNVLDAVNKTPSVHRVVLTSSVAAIYGDNQDLEKIGNRRFTEANWNTTSSAEHQPYSYSKTLAERRAWQMAEIQDHWNLVVINPGLVVGPPLSDQSGSESIKIIQQLTDGSLKMGVPQLHNGVVDVRNVAEAHIAAAQKDGAQGRHILVNKVMTLLEMSEILRTEFGTKYALPSRELPKFLVWLAAPTVGLTRKYVKQNVGYPIAFDNSKSTEQLGINYIPVAKTLTDHVRAMEKEDKSAQKTMTS